MERDKWTNPSNAFIQTDWGGNEEMIIEVQFLIAFFLAFTASILALKLGQALYE
uniref:Photosystem I reaction center subunit XII n=32 Tax=Pinaceae TaxID=3318 RepID=A0A346PZZ2_9CONI|nr:PSI M protein [Pinus parviflora]YP_009524312.1 PSI M protein [Pinus morrisonicola]AXR86245.1 PSI M protein [Pinus parviflora]AXR86318.1 PSI M protein [Pinus morrisonicola]